MPVTVNLQPSGRYLMEDFYYAGGLTGFLGAIREKLHLDAATVNGRTIGENVAGAAVHNDDVIRPLDKPIYGAGATAVLFGNLAPDGCVMKPCAAEPRFLKHEGPALVFRDYNEMAAMIDRDELDVTADTVLVLQNAGPVGGPGMPEWGMLPLPKKLLKQGVRDMLRVSDARMSGTSYGACVLHVSPESHIGGPLAAVRTGDIISVDVENRRIDVQLSDEQIAARLAEWRPPSRDYPRGYNQMFARHIGQAHEGCDFDFLTGAGGIPEPEIH
jgi:dihydroxy-acid dehydratase